MTDTVDTFEWKDLEYLTDLDIVDLHQISHTVLIIIIITILTIVVAFCFILWKKYKVQAKATYNLIIAHFHQGNINPLTPSDTVRYRQISCYYLCRHFKKIRWG